MSKSHTFLPAYINSTMLSVMFMHTAFLSPSPLFEYQFFEHVYCISNLCLNHLKSYAQEFYA